MFSSRSSMVSDLTFRLLIQFEFIFVNDVRKCSNFIFNFFFLKIVFTTWGLLCFHTNFRNICCSFVKYASSILIQIALNL